MTRSWRRWRRRAAASPRAAADTSWAACVPPSSSRARVVRALLHSHQVRPRHGGVRSGTVCNTPRTTAVCARARGGTRRGGWPASSSTSTAGGYHPGGHHSSCNDHERDQDVYTWARSCASTSRNGGRGSTSTSSCTPRSCGRCCAATRSCSQPHGAQSERGWVRRHHLLRGVPPSWKARPASPRAPGTSTEGSKVWAPFRTARRGRSCCAGSSSSAITWPAS